MQLSLGFSPCPNDTFIFDALLHNKIDTEGLVFNPVIEDVETLNRKVFAGELDITKLSYHAFAYLLDHYVLLNAGSALGFGVGPILIAAPELLTRLQIDDTTDRLSGLRIYPDLKIGIPGKLTTANFLLGLAFPEATNKQEMLFSDIENALIRGEIDLGLIIHENRFTYEAKGLKKVIDLGEFWEKETGSAIPLGGIVASRKMDHELILKIDRVLRRSVEYAFANPKSSYGFVRAHSQEMSEEVMYKHIELYVNKYSVDLAEEGRRAVEELFARARSLNLIPLSKETIFID